MSTERTSLPAEAFSIPTLGEMARTCKDLSEQSLFNLRRASERIRDCQPGPELDYLRCDYSRHLADYKHWKGYAQYYRERAAREGELTRPKLTWRMDYKPEVNKYDVDNDSSVPF